MSQSGSLKKKGVVYGVPCTDCDAVYIGETMSTMSVRLQEHNRRTSSMQLQHSAIAEHAGTLGHSVNWEAATVLGNEMEWDNRKIKEALHIKCSAFTRDIINKDTGWHVSDMCSDLLKRKVL